VPTITIKVSAEEKAAAEAAAARAGQNVSEYARESMRLREAHPGLPDTIKELIDRSNAAIVVGTIVDDLTRRVEQLEQGAKR
jgi:arginine repressor